MGKIKIVNEQGQEEEIEAFLPDEVDAKMKEKEEEFNKVIAEKDTTLQSLTKEKEELISKMGDVKEDHPNFKVLKDALSKKDSEINGIKSEIEKDREERKIGGLITKISKGNEELEKKIRYHLESTLVGMKATTPEELQKKVDAALKLSQDHGSQGMFDNGVGGTGGNYSNTSSNTTGTVEFSPKEKALGAKLGLTEDDYKKYGPRLKK